MSWVAVAVGGAAVIGAGASAYSSNQSSKASAATIKEASKDANSTQLYMYDQSRNDFMPFMEPSNRAMATLQSALYGGPVQYDDATTRPLSDEEVMAANWEAILADQDKAKYRLRQDVWNDIAAGEDPALRLMRERDAKGGRELTGLAYNLGQQWYRGADGKLTNVAPQKLTATFQPQESEGFKYIKQRTGEDLGRSLRMMGRGSGTVAANAYGRTMGELNAANEQQQYGRLTDAVKIAQGAAGSVQGSGMNYANNVSANQMNTGNTLANIGLQNGQTKANLYAGLGGTATNAYGTYQMGQYLNKAGG